MALRVLQVSDKEPTGGGVAVHLSILSAGLERRGHRVVHLQLTDRDAGRPDGSAARYRLRPSYGLLRGHLLRPQLRRVLAEFRPDLVHVHGCFTTLSPVLLGDLRRRAPIVGTLHDIRPFCYLATRRFAPTGAQCQRQCGIGCFSSGCVRPQRFSDLLRLPRRWLVDRLTLAQWRRLDRVVVPSSYLRALALQHAFPAAQLRLVPHGTAILPTPAPRTGTASPPLVVFCGSLIEHKGLGLFIAALDCLRERAWQAILIGDGPMRGALEDEVRQRGLSGRVRFLGHVADRERVNDFLARARLLALPSTVPESFSLAGLEALAAGTPVVSFGLGGVRDWLRDEENGLLAADGDTRDLARQMGRLLDHPHLARDLGAGGRDLVARRFTPDLAFEGLLAVYNEALDAWERRRPMVG